MISLLNKDFPQKEQYNSILLFIIICFLNSPYWRYYRLDQVDQLCHLISYGNSKQTNKRRIYSILVFFQIVTSYIACATYTFYLCRLLGEFVNRHKQGKGKYYIDEFLIYQGDFAHGSMHGSGRLIDYNGSEFVGQFLNGKKMKGNFRSINGIIRNSFNSTNENADGYYEWDDGKFYIGGFKKNKFQGHGRIYHVNGRVIEGVWEKGHNKTVTRLLTLTEDEVKTVQMGYKRETIDQQEHEQEDDHSEKFPRAENRRYSAQISEKSLNWDHSNKDLVRQSQLVLQ